MLAFAQCRALFVNEVMEAAFCWNKSFVPPFKWRGAHFERLADCPDTVREGIASLAVAPPSKRVLVVAKDVLAAVKRLVGDRLSLDLALGEPLSAYAHAVHRQIGNRTIREATSLDW